MSKNTPYNVLLKQTFKRSRKELRDTLRALQQEKPTRVAQERFGLTADSSRMAKGIVKWFNDKKGFGFIVDPAVDGDIFVHFSAILPLEGRRTLKEGEEVEYELCKEQKGSRAKSVTRV
jgi:CspA family cold shock protein